MLNDDEMANIVAWAAQQGYDPEKDYTGAQGLPPGYLSPNFHEDEFRSNGDGTLGPRGIDPELVMALEMIRGHFDAPVTITSGYRDPAYNASIGGASNSRHTYGDAADFVVQGVSPAQVYAEIDPYHQAGGLGKYNTFTHIDMRGYRARW